MAEAEKEMIWMTDYLEELGKKQHKKILYKDSESVIQLVRNPVYHKSFFIKIVRVSYSW